MKFNYARTAKTADRLLKRFGATTLIKKTTNTYDPTTGTASGTSIQFSVTAAVFDYEQKFIDGTLIREGDKQAYVSALVLSVPSVGDVMEWLGKDCAIVFVTPLNPAGTNVLYTLRIREIGVI